MAATITIPGEFRELFDAEAKVAFNLIGDREGEFTVVDELREATALVVTANRSDGAVALTVPATSAALIAVTGCISATARSIPYEDPPNNPDTRGAGETAAINLLRWYGIAAAFPEGVEG